MHYLHNTNARISICFVILILLYGLEQLENEARNAKRGLWQDKAPVPPWEFRKKKKQQSFVYRVTSLCELIRE